MEQFPSKERSPHLESLQEKFEYYIKDIPLTEKELQGSLLDVGADTGKFVQYLREVMHNTEAKAVEFQKQKIKPEHAEWHIQADGRALPFEDDSFDTVIAHNYLPMFVGNPEDMQTVLNELIRVVKEKGRVMGDIATVESVQKSEDEIKINLGEAYTKKDESNFQEKYAGAKALQVYIEQLQLSYDVHVVKGKKGNSVLIIQK